MNGKDLKEQASTLNVLYAEDEQILREGMQNILVKLFKNTYVAADGKEAFEIFKKEEIDIVITDINMPIMSGTELIENIQEYTDKLPVIIVLSAHNESKLLSSLINLGIDGFLNKPLEKQFLIDILLKACTNINNAKLVADYQTRIKSLLNYMIRKNRILAQKQKQLASLRNENELKKPLLDEKIEPKNENYYSSLLIEDKDELADLSAELDNYITIVFNNEKLLDTYIEKLAAVYKKYASILNAYHEFSEVAIPLNLLSKTMPTLSDKFLKDTSQTATYLESLQVTFENFRQNTWNKPADNPKFYNASLIHDIYTVLNFLNNIEAEENEIEFF